VAEAGVFCCVGKTFSDLSYLALLYKDLLSFIRLRVGGGKRRKSCTGQFFLPNEKKFLLGQLSLCGKIRFSPGILSTTPSRFEYKPETGKNQLCHSRNNNKL
jgi:hypothetical protein